MKTTNNKEYDFYYSLKGEITERIYSPRRYFRNRIYTEAVKKGEKPASVWDDLTLVGTGTFDDVVIQQPNS